MNISAHYKYRLSLPDEWAVEQALAHSGLDFLSLFILTEIRPAARLLILTSLFTINCFVIYAKS